MGGELGLLEDSERPATEGGEPSELAKELGR